MYTIAKRFTFDASHQLHGLPDGHKCARLHGHTYTVELVLVGDLDGAGMVYDYGNLAAFKQLIDTQLDHRHLNDWVAAHPMVGASDPAHANPTAERLAYLLYATAEDLDIPGLLEVRVAETPNTWASWRVTHAIERVLERRLDQLERTVANLPVK